MEIKHAQILAAIVDSKGDVYETARVLGIQYSDLKAVISKYPYLREELKKQKKISKSQAQNRVTSSAPIASASPNFTFTNGNRPEFEQPEIVSPRPTKGAINQRILVISDTHAPYQHPDALDFLSALHQKYSFTRVIHIGDEVDNHAMSFHDSDPNLPSAGNELHLARVWLHALERIFPEMDLVKSNHGDMYERKARHSGIPQEALHSRATLYKIGGGWHFHDELILELPTGYNCQFVHQRCKNSRNASLAAGMSLVQGHHHTVLDIQYRSTPDASHFGMGVGCLIDAHNPAFRYAQNNKDRPTIGCGMILNGTPAIAPLFLRNRRWTGLVP